MSQSTEPRDVAKLVGRLIDVCRETQFVFEIAAGGVRERLLRAELLQYADQRREFVADLVAALRRVGDRVIDPGSLSEPLLRSSQVLQSAITQGDVSAILGECEHAESIAQAQYHDVLSYDLATSTSALLQSQLAAMSRVQHRLHRLRLNARSERN